MKGSRSINDSQLWELKQQWDERRRNLGIPEPKTDLAAIDLDEQRQCLQQEGVAIPHEIGHRTAFTSTNPCMDFEFLYPAGWRIQELVRQEHNEVLILGPRNRNNTYNLALAVHVFPALAQDGKFATIEEVVDDYVGTIRQQRDFQKLSQVRGVLAGFEAIELAIRYTISKPSRKASLKDIPVIERRIFLKRKDRFYELIYRAAEEDYYTFLPAFKTLVQTFEFIDRPRESQEFYPLVTQYPAHALREQDSGYTDEE